MFPFFSTVLTTPSSCHLVCLRAVKNQLELWQGQTAGCDEIEGPALRYLDDIICCGCFLEMTTPFFS